MSCGRATPVPSLKLSVNPHVLCATERGWRLSNSPERSPNYLSILAPKFMEHADTSQGFIGITNRNPVLMSAISAKKSSRMPLTPTEEELSHLIQMGVNP
jgi:hypothetical protein